MSILGALAALFKPASELGQQYIKGKQEVEQAKISAKTAKWLAKASAYENDAQRTHDWEMEALRQMQYSWKDEFWTIVMGFIMLFPILFGMLGAFTGLPVFQEAMTAAWAAYSEMPAVFMVILPVMILASIGVRYKGKREAADAIRNLGVGNDQTDS